MKEYHPVRPRQMEIITSEGSFLFFFQSATFKHNHFPFLFFSYSERSSPQSNKNYRGNRKPGNLNQFTFNRLSNYNDNSSLYTPPDRFLTRAHLVEIKTAPDTLVNGSQWDSLSQMIWDKFQASQQSENTYKKKMYLWRYLYLCVKVSILLLIFVEIRILFLYTKIEHCGKIFV